MSLSSRSSQRSSPSSPCSANDGARRRLDRNRALPLPPWPAGGGQPAVALVHQVGQHACRPGRRPTVPSGTCTMLVVAPLAVLLLARAVRAVGGPAVGVVAEGEQRGHVAVGDQPDVAARAAVTAVGSALGHVGLATDRHAAGPAVAAAHVDVALVDEAGHDGTAYGVWTSTPQGFLRREWAAAAAAHLIRWTGSPITLADHVVVSCGLP